jgi:hypothetical protein
MNGEKNGACENSARFILKAFIKCSLTKQYSLTKQSRDSDANRPEWRFCVYWALAIV